MSCNSINKMIKSDTFYAVGLLLPAICVVGLIIFIPLLRAIGMSFQNYSLLRPDNARFNGFANYLNLFKTKAIWEIIRNTLFFVLSTSFLELLVGFSFALLLNTVKKTRNFLSSIALINWITPSVVVAFIWRWMFHGEYGVVNYILTATEVLDYNLQWISHKNGAMMVIIIAHMWKQFPFMMIMILAGLQTIPKDIVESSTIDGASSFQRFFHILLPFLKNILLISTLLSMIRNFQSFTIIWLITEGGPVNMTSTLSIDVFRKAFLEYDMGQASAVGTVWLLFLVLISIVYIRLMATSRVYD